MVTEACVYGGKRKLVVCSAFGIAKQRLPASTASYCRKQNPPPPPRLVGSGRGTDRVLCNANDDGVKTNGAPGT